MDTFIQFAYVAAAVLFIFGLKQLGSPATARRVISNKALYISSVASLGIVSMSA